MSLPILAGERVVLRPLRAEDRSVLRGYLAEPEVARRWDTSPDRAVDDLFQSQDQAAFAIEVDGGGHTWPDANLILSRLISAATTHTFSATRTIWGFFAAHTLEGAPPSSGRPRAPASSAVTPATTPAQKSTAARS